MMHQQHQTNDGVASIAAIAGLMGKADRTAVSCLEQAEDADATHKDGLLAQAGRAREVALFLRHSLQHRQAANLPEALVQMACAREVASALASLVPPEHAQRTADLLDMFHRLHFSALRAVEQGCGQTVRELSSEFLAADEFDAA